MIDVTTYILARGYTAAAIASGQSKNKEIEIDDVSGTLPEGVLADLTKSNASVIKLSGKYYRLSRVEGDNYKYINSTTNGAGQIINMTELDVDKNTGEFQTKQIIFEGSSVAYLEDELQEHITDNTRHITAAERTKWNNKASVSIAKDTDSEGDEDYILNLIKG